MVQKVKEVIAILEKNGWVFQRMRGSHRIYFKEGECRPITVPGNLNDDLKDGTLGSILRQSGLK